MLKIKNEFLPKLGHHVEPVKTGKKFTTIKDTTYLRHLLYLLSVEACSQDKQPTDWLSVKADFQKKLYFFDGRGYLVAKWIPEK